MNNHNTLVMSAFALDALQKQFNEEVYPDAKFFFPDDAGLRQLKFTLWLLDRYGAKDNFIAEAEKFHMLTLLQKS